MTSFFSVEGGKIWIKILETGAEWHVDCGDVVEIETRCRIPIWRTFWGIQWHVIPEPPAILQAAATWWIHCHDSRATCHIAGYSNLAKSMSWSCHIARCKNSIRHIENRFSPYFIYFLFLMQRRLSYRLWYTCYWLGMDMWIVIITLCVPVDVHSVSSSSLAKAVHNHSTVSQKNRTTTINIT